MKNDKLEEALNKFEEINAKISDLDEIEKEDYADELEAAKAEAIEEAKKELKEIEEEKKKLEKEVKKTYNSKIRELEEMRIYEGNADKREQLEEKINNIKEEKETKLEVLNEALIEKEEKLLDKIEEKGLHDTDIGLRRNTKGIKKVKTKNSIVLKIIAFLTSKFKFFKDKKVYKSNDRKLRRIIEKAMNKKEEELEEIAEEDLSEKIIKETEKQIETHEKESNQKEKQPKEEKQQKTKPSIEFSINSGKYILTDEKGQKHEKDFDKNSFTEQAKEEFAKEIASKIAEAKREKFRYKIQWLTNVADKNVFDLLTEADKNNKSRMAEKYLMAILAKKGENQKYMPVNLKYNLVLDSKMPFKKEEVKDILELAEGQSKMGIATIENKVIKKEDIKPKNEVKQENNEKDIKPTEKEKLRVDFSLKKGIYKLVDKNGLVYEAELNNELLTKEARGKFAIEMLETYYKNPTVEQIQAVKEFAKTADISLFGLYEIYDRENNTHFAKQYMDSQISMQQKFDEKAKVEMPTDVVYNIEKRANKKGILKLYSRKEEKQIEKMAKSQEKLQLAEVIRDPKMKLWKRISLALGIAGTATALGVGTAKVASNIEKSQEREVIDFTEFNKTEEVKEKPQKATNAFKESLEVSQEKIDEMLEYKENTETLNKDINSAQIEEEKAKVGIGSKAVLEEGTYYYNSNLDGPIGKMENRDSKDVEINLIAVIGEDGEMKHCLTKGNMDEILKENPNSKIIVHIANKDGDLGWIPYENVKGNFEQNINKEVEDDFVK